MLQPRDAGYAGRVRLPSALAVAVLMTTAAGCGSVAGERNAAASAARSFYAELARGDGARACSDLVPETRHKLEESEGKPCPEAVTSLQLSGQTVRLVDVYGRQGRVVLEGDTAFLAKFGSRWRIAAAGCKKREKLPYDCELVH